MKKILLLIIASLLLYSFIVTYKLISNSPEIVTVHDTIPGDSVFTTITVNKPEPYIVTKYNTDTIEIPADTVKLKEKYKELYAQLYASKTYRDSLKNVSDNDIVYNVYISQNSLDSLKIDVKNNRITTVNNTVINNNKPKLQAGIQVSFKSISPTLMYNVKDNFNISADYDLLNKSIGLGIFYNIK